MESRVINFNGLGMKVGEIFSTYDYDMFEPTKDNRISLDIEPTDAPYRRLKKQIIDYGTNYNPIICNYIGGKLIIVSGHHRYLACKFTNNPITYTIDNNYTFDMSIQETKATSNWTSSDKFKRGLKNDVPVCIEINRITSKYPTIKDMQVGRLVAFDGFKRATGLTRNKVINSLETYEGIEYLKQITFTPEELEEVEKYVARYVEVILISKRYAIGCTGDKRAMGVRTFSQTAFNAVYDTLDKYWDTFINNFTRLCKDKNRTNCSNVKLKLYQDVIGSTDSAIKQAFKEIIFLYD